MSVPRNESGTATHRGRAKAKSAEQGTQDTASKLADLMLFVQGQEHQPDVGVQMGNICENIQLLMDDALIQALDRLLVVYTFVAEPDTKGTLQDVYPAQELLIMLRDLQKTRLRDALERFINQPN